MSTIERAVQSVSYTVVGIFLGMMIADIAPGSVAAAREWQTLIAGILAVFAAYLTIRQMRISDQLNQSRHMEVRKTEAERERLIARRAGPSVAAEIRGVVSRGRERRIAINGDLLLNDFRNYAPKIKAVQLALQSVISRPALSEVRPLLEPEADDCMHSAREALAGVGGLVDSMTPLALDGALSAEYSEGTEMVLIRLDQAFFFMESLADELEKLCKKYDV